MAQHTRAPWTVERDADGRFIVYADACALQVAQVETEADALLIAAAPKLLQAAKKALASGLIQPPDPVGNPGTLTPVWDALTEAVAAAEGKEEDELDWEEPSGPAKIAVPGDLVLYPIKLSAVASASAERAGIARSYNETVWCVGAVTRVSRDGYATGIRSYTAAGSPLDIKGPINGQYVGSASKLAPLTADAVARRLAGQDFRSIDAARDAILAVIAEARAE